MVQQDSTKKSVLYFIPEFPVLTETFIEREIAEMARRGNLDVKIVSLRKASGTYNPILKDKIFYKRLNVLDILLGLRFIVQNYSRVAEVYKVLRKCGLSFSERMFLLLKGLGYTGIFLSYKPDFIIGHFMGSTSTLVMIISTITGVPFGISAHARDITVNPHCMKEKVARAKFTVICNRYAYDACITELDQKSREKVFLRYHGLDFSEIQVTEKYSFSDIPVILIVARLEEKKGLSYLIDAAKLLKDRGKKFRINIVGPGVLYNDLEQKILNNSLENHVFILGNGKGLPYGEIQKMYEHSDIFVFSGITTESGDADGIATVLLEASAYGLPVVTTDSGSSGELIENGVNGIIVPQRDPRALAEGLLQMMNNFKESQSMAQKAREKVRHDFDLKVNVGEIEKLVLEGINK